MTEIMVLLAILMEQSGDRVSEVRLNLLAETLLPYGPGRVCPALKELIATSRRFPTVAEVLAVMGEDTPQDDDQARLAAEAIWDGICKYGSQKINLEDKLGPIAAAVVNRQGGWLRICDLATYDNAPTLKAQWRQLAEAMIRAHRRGELDVKPAFNLEDFNGRVRSLS